MSGFNYRKSIQALNFFAGGVGNVQNKMKALKLIWLSDRLHLRMYGRTITGDDYVAMKNGPVASATRNILELNSHPEIENYSQQYIVNTGYNFRTGREIEYKSIKALDEDVFSDSDIEVMSKVRDTYGSLTQWDLSDLSHYFPEWAKYRDSLNEQMKKFDMQTEDFFNNFDDGSRLFVDDEEYLNSARELFNHYRQISAFL